jgi:hypothetical protein
MKRRIVVTVSEQMVRAWWTRNHPRGRMPSRRRMFFAMIRNLLFGWLDHGYGPEPQRPVLAAPATLGPTVADPAIPAPVSRTPIRCTAPPALPIPRIGCLTL